MTNNISFCPVCGSKITDYKHSINKTLVECLARLYAMGGRSRLDKLGLDNTHFNNFQKLRYFGLAVPSGENSEWQITNQGIWFLQGRIQISRFVITRNAKVIRSSTELVFITEVKDCVSYKIEWKEQARQPSLFDK
ncbi:MAG: hypothetical protein IKP24_00595 [Alphaproteobacteria bacterium]|nr:hypothetical protein [Alphaproteobacteria bacterium]